MFILKELVSQTYFTFFKSFRCYFSPSLIKCQFAGHILWSTIQSGLPEFCPFWKVLFRHIAIISNDKVRMGIIIIDVFIDSSLQGEFIDSSWQGKFIDSSWQREFIDSSWQREFIDSSWQGEFIDSSWQGEFFRLWTSPLHIYKLYAHEPSDFISNLVILHDYFSLIVQF